MAKKKSKAEIQEAEAPKLTAAQILDEAFKAGWRDGRDFALKWSEDGLRMSSLMLGVIVGFIFGWGITVLGFVLS